MAQKAKRIQPAINGQPLLTKAKAAYQALSKDGQGAFCEWLFDEPKSPAHIVVKSMLALMLHERREKEAAQQKAKAKKPDIAAYQEILEVKKARSWPKVVGYYKSKYHDKRPNLQDILRSRYRLAKKWQAEQEGPRSTTLII